MLRTAMGPAIAAALADPLVAEVMVNPDGALRLHLVRRGRVATRARGPPRSGEVGPAPGEGIPPDRVESIIRLVASHARAEAHGTAPIVSAELPPHGER